MCNNARVHGLYFCPRKVKPCLDAISGSLRAHDFKEDERHESIVNYILYLFVVADVC